MNWTDFFNDLQKWMEASNEISKKHPITTDEYWNWLIKTIGIIGDRYNNHPLVLDFLTVLIQFQDDNYKKLVGGK